MASRIDGWPLGDLRSGCVLGETGQAPPLRAPRAFPRALADSTRGPRPSTSGKEAGGNATGALARRGIGAGRTVGGRPAPSAGLLVAEPPTGRLPAVTCRIPGQCIRCGTRSQHVAAGMARGACAARLPSAATCSEHVAEKRQAVPIDAVVRCARRARANAGTGRAPAPRPFERPAGLRPRPRAGTAGRGSAPARQCGPELGVALRLSSRQATAFASALCAVSAEYAVGVPARGQRERSGCARSPPTNAAASAP